MKRGFIYSMLMHSLLLLLLVSGAANKGATPEGDVGMEGKEKGGGKGDEVEVTIIPKMSEVGPSDAGKGLLAKAPHAGDKCDEFYGGVGITTYIQMLPDGTWHTIASEVVPGYPASNAGLQVGDVIHNSDALRGEIGSPIEIQIERFGQRLTLSTFRDKICTEKAGSP